MANLLSDQLAKSFSVNWKGEKFISFRQLDSLLSEATVTHIVQQTSIPPYEWKDAQRAILPGGKESLRRFVAYKGRIYLWTSSPRTGF